MPKCLQASQSPKKTREWRQLFSALKLSMHRPMYRTGALERVFLKNLWWSLLCSPSLLWEAEKQGPGLGVRCETLWIEPAKQEKLWLNIFAERESVWCFHWWMAGWSSAFTSPVSSFLTEETNSSLQREPVPPRKGGEQRGYFCLIVPLICGGIFLLSLFFHHWVRHYGTQL